MNKNYSYFLNYLNKNKNTSKKKVLDFGCGEGKLLNILIENGFDAYGVDTNHTKNNKKYIGNKLVEKNKLKLITEDENLPFEDGYFNFVISNMVFEHVFNIELAVSEIYRVLKNDGIAYLRFPSYEIVREGHTGIPFTHRFKNKKLLRLYMNFAFSLGFGVNRKKHGTKEEWVNHMIDYLENKTIYRKKSEIMKIFSQFYVTQKEISFLEFYFQNKRILKYLLSTKFKHLLIFAYKKYVTLDFELRKII